MRIIEATTEEILAAGALTVDAVERLRAERTGVPMPVQASDLNFTPDADAPPLDVAIMTLGGLLAGLGDVDTAIGVGTAAAYLRETPRHLGPRWRDLRDALEAIAGEAAFIVETMDAYVDVLGDDLRKPEPA